MYTFKEEDARMFAKFLHVPTRRSGSELAFHTCPYCHGGGKNDKNTFSINLNTGMFQCMRSKCGKRGNMLTLAADFGFSLDNSTEPSRKYKELPQKEVVVRQNAIDYLKSRGISRETVERYQITTRTDRESVLVFPFYSPDGSRIEFIKYRNTEFKKGDAGSKEWCEANCKPVLYGMNIATDKTKPLIITEGQIDSLSVAECGIPNAVSVPTGAKGFTWVPHCYEWMNEFKTLIVFGDYENGGMTLLEELAKRFNGIVKHVRFEDYRGCKDANEILQKEGRNAVLNAVNNAIRYRDNHIKSMADVRRKVLSDDDRIKTGVKKLDSIIGGFYFGQLIILTGERGKGKSTLASEFLMHAVGQKVTSLIYSGELLDWQVQACFERQVAGRLRINKRENDGGFNTYTIRPEDEAHVANWYRDYVYMYNNAIYSESNDYDVEKLTDTIEKAIRQYEVRFIVIDNLMTAMDDDLSSDIYRQQSKFVKDLSIIAKKYEVIIMLVAHPKKTGKDGYIGNDDIMGSSNITNLADIVLKYDVPAGSSGAPRALQVWKNRVNGHITTKDEEIPMYYDEASKRVSDSSGEFNLDIITDIYRRKVELPATPIINAGTEFDTGDVLIEIDEDDLPF